MCSYFSWFGIRNGTFRTYIYPSIAPIRINIEEICIVKYKAKRERESRHNVDLLLQATEYEEA